MGSRARYGHNQSLPKLMRADQAKLLIMSAHIFGLKRQHRFSDGAIGYTDGCSHGFGPRFGNPVSAVIGRAKNSLNMLGRGISGTSAGGRVAT